MRSDWSIWYEQLIKPPWTPPPWVFGTAWSVLYPIIFVTFGFVLVQIVRGKIPLWVGIPFLINLLTNLAFMPIFSGWRNLWFATADVLVIWGTIVWAIVAVWPYARWVAILQIPYLLWVTFAGVLIVYILIANM